jgi:hypothetical protein
VRGAVDASQVGGCRRGAPELQEAKSVALDMAA